MEKSRPSIRAARSQIPCVHGPADAGAAYDLAIDFHCRDADFVEAELVAHFFQ